MNAYYHPMLHKSLAIPKSTKSTASACPCPSVPVRACPCPSVPVARIPRSSFRVPHSPSLPSLSRPFHLCPPLILRKLRNTTAHFRSKNVQNGPKRFKVSSSAVDNGPKRSKNVPCFTLIYPPLTQYVPDIPYRTPYILWTPRFPSLIPDQDAPMSLKTVKKFPPSPGIQIRIPHPASAHDAHVTASVKTAGTDCGADLRSASRCTPDLQSHTLNFTFHTSTKTRVKKGTGLRRSRLARQSQTLAHLHDMAEA